MRRRTAHVRAGIGQVEEQLAPSGFVRVHRGALANSNSAEALQVNAGEYSLRLQNGSSVPVSRRRLDRVRAALG
ncbi:LytTR family DNA-binding domain-containing protein [Saltatorellus ferox]|uniref:LytTR family DNA-binding domain-containing protein n=1 Tax=Saltatorellus ferox TaxID=2528018 RepID=UPI003AF3DCE7